MTSALHKRIDISDSVTEDSGSVSPDCPEDEKIVKNQTFSLTFGYKYQWVVVFSEQYLAPTPYPQKSCVHKKANDLKVAL